MQFHERVLPLFLLLLAALGLGANLSIFRAADPMALRDPVMQLTGLLAMGSVCAAVILALRQRWSERLLGGLDKSYRLHRAFGIAALVFAILHWIAAKALPRAPLDGENPAIAAQRHLAESVGEWAFYALLLLILMALVPRVPYRVFYKSHRVMGLVFFALLFHSVNLFSSPSWATPVGVVLALLLVAGVTGAVLSLVDRIGATRRMRAKAIRLQLYPEYPAMEGELEVLGEWPGHKPGQFAFVKPPGREEHHPFTIASAWDPVAKTLTFISKELGDFTSTLKDRAHVGGEVTIEGPYGSFTFDDDCPVQIWIAGGIGITPFIARMKYLAREPQSGKPVHLFHSTSDYSEEAIAKLTATAAEAGVKLHVIHGARDGLLTGDRVRANAPDWQSASIWFCGPAGFGAAILRDFKVHGFDRRRFHQELFAWR